MGGESEAARIAHRATDAGGVEALVVDLVVEAEGEVVVAPARGDLLAHKDQHVVVPALLAAPLGLERVVVCEEDHVGVGAPRRARDLGNGPGPVRVERVEVDYAGEVVQGPSVALAP